LVTGGGLNKELGWRRVVKSCLLPRGVLMSMFRRKYLDAISRALTRGELTLPPDRKVSQVQGLLNKLGRATWNVNIREKYEHGRGVLTYLARYVRGGPISNRRLVACRDGVVLFRYRDNRDSNGQGRPRSKTKPLPVNEFLYRVLQHVPPPGMQMVRSYGLYATSQREMLDRAREEQGEKRVPAAAELNWQDLLEQLIGDSEGAPHRCPVCGSQLERTVDIAPARDPPAIFLKAESNLHRADAMLRPANKVLSPEPGYAGTPSL
jgi:hypothetical protein